MKNNTLTTLEPIPTAGLNASIAALDAAIEAMQVREEAPTGGTAFVIDSESAANWYIRRLVRIDQEKATVKAQAAQRIAELDADKSRLEFLYQSQLEAWAHEEAGRRRRKTITLQNGTVSIRMVPEHVRITDAEASLAYVQSLGEEGRHLIVNRDPILYEFAWKQRAQGILTETGTVPPGCEFVPARESVSIKTAKEKESIEG